MGFLFQDLCTYRCRSQHNRRLSFKKSFKMNTITVTRLLGWSQSVSLANTLRPCPLRLLLNLRTSHFSTSSLPFEEIIQMRKEHGNYKLPIPLSTREIHVFLLQERKEVSSLIHDIKHEDATIQDIAVLDMEGKRIAKSTSIEDLLKVDWKLRLDGRIYIVRSPPRSQVGGEHVELVQEYPEYQKVRHMFEERAKNQATLSLCDYYEWAEDMGLAYDTVRQRERKI